MAGHLFNIGAYGLQHGTINWETDTIMARLSETTEDPDQDVLTMTGIGLPATSYLVENCVGPTNDNALDRIVYTSDRLVFPTVASGPEVDKIVLYKFVTNDADSVPIATVGIQAITPNGGGIGVTPTAVGLFYTQQ